MNNAIRRKGSTEIASHLRREIIAGNLAAKERLPPERVLADQYGVARGPCAKHSTVWLMKGWWKFAQALAAMSVSTPWGKSMP